MARRRGTAASLTTCVKSHKILVMSRKPAFTPHGRSRVARQRGRVSPFTLHSHTWVSSSSTDQELMSYSPSIGSKGRSQVSTVPFIDAKNEARSGAA